MKELSRYLFLAGGLPFLLLGSVHALSTPRQPHERKALSPSDPNMAESMARERVLLTSRVNMWQGWVGFNLSHSLGIVLFGVLVVLVGRTSASFQYNAAVLLPFAVAVCLAYLGIGLAYFFRTPIIGTCLALLLFSSAWVLHLLGRT
jgi:hypothetical protein